ncbi:MAG TPA: hypothetical protein VGP19_14595 [Candidatus Acidoferrales bacterium]|jgi:hypothetical protein|nr:hypothetical protein [Candidatus Acidoferrales bacterium]
MQTEMKEAKDANLRTHAARSSAFLILIVDDEVTTQNLCRDVASDAGLQV